MRPPSARALLAAARIPAFLVTNPVSLRYLTGVQTSGGALLILSREMTLYLDGRYREEAEDASAKVRDVQDLPAALKRLPLCGFESDAVTVAQLQRWKKKYRGTAFQPQDEALRLWRRSKDEDELALFRRAQKITRSVLKMVPSWLKPGVTEREIAHRLLSAVRELGAEELAFDPIVAFGSHTSRPHHHPTARALRKGDLVQIDVGARFGGYCSDQSRIFFTGKPTAMQERALVAVQEAKAAAEHSIVPGVTTHALDKAARSVLRKYGMEDAFLHALGHGVGLEIHEGVSISQKRPAEKLLQNEIITIEPGVYFPGKFGIRLEDEMVVGC